MKKESLIKYYFLYRVQIFTAAVALASLFLIIFVIYPQTANLLSNQQKIGELRSKHQFLETKVTALESFDEAELSRKVGYVLATFPQDKDLARILTLLKQLAAQSGFTITEIVFSNTSSNKLGNLDTYGVKLDIKGPRIMLSSLLNNLENSPRLVRINSIEVSLSQTSQSTDTALVLEVIYSQQSQEASGIDSPLPELTQKDEELIARLAKINEVVSSFDIQSIPRGKTNPFE